MWRSVRTYLEMIKVSHTVFALPFAVGAAFLAGGGVPPLGVLLKIVLAVFFARTAAMSFNRLVDRDLDAANPRTADRALPSGALSRTFVTVSVIASLCGFVAVAFWLNRLAFILSPIAIIVIFLYSFTKRFTVLCHVVLGAALALAPLGAWVAVRGEFAREPWLLGGAVLLWTAGFDIIYSCLDVDFDRTKGLYSIPARFGVATALKVSAALHAGMFVLLGILGWTTAALGMVFATVLVLIFGLLVYEHRLVSARDLSRVNRAFFTMNGVISVLLMSAMILEVTLPW